MQQRGRDAWGASDGSVLLKHKGPLTESWAQDREQIDTWNSGIFHTRGASHGTPREEENAHPFVYPKEDGSTVIGIHNGLVSNHASLATKYNRQCAVDSQHLWMHRAERKDWSDIQGWGNLVWWEVHKDAQRINLCRFNTDNLKVARLEGGEFVFASETTPISVMSAMMGNPVKYWVAIDEYYHYWFQENNDGVVDLWRGSKLEFGRTPVVTPPFHTVNNNTHQQQREWSATKPFCYGCNTVRCAEDDDLLCFSCLRVQIANYLAYGKDDKIWHDVPTVGSLGAEVGYHSNESHIRVKASGDFQKIKCFHFILGKLDPDYPFAPPSMRRYTTLVTCDTCRGAVYFCPMITADQLKALAKQLDASIMLDGHLKVKVSMFNKQCPGIKKRTTNQLMLVGAS